MKQSLFPLPKPVSSSQSEKSPTKGELIPSTDKSWTKLSSAPKLQKLHFEKLEKTQPEAISKEKMTNKPTIKQVHQDDIIIDNKGDYNQLLFQQPIGGKIPKYKRFGDNSDKLEKKKWEETRDSHVSNEILYEKGKFMRSAKGNVKNTDKERYWNGLYSTGQSDPSTFYTTLDLTETEKVDTFVPLESVIDHKLTQEELFLQKTQQFNESLRKDPKNEQLWLDFVNFQDEMIKMYPNRSIKGNIEKKLAIFDKALQENPKSVNLWISSHKEAQKLYTKDQMESLWQRSLLEIPNSYLLWKEYLSYTKTTFSIMNYTFVRQIYKRSLANLTECERIMILGDLANFEKQMGYSARAIGLMQAMIEINVNLPFPFGNWELQKITFQPFWESECPRCGEDNAKGWKDWLIHFNIDDLNENEGEDDVQEQEVQFDANDDIVDVYDEIQNVQVFYDWMRIEESKMDPLPYRLRDLDSVSPDQIILFDDISPFLFAVQKEENLLTLMKIFLEILGINVIFRSYSLFEFNRDSSKSLISVLDSKYPFDWVMGDDVHPKARQMVKNVFETSISLFSDSNLIIHYLNFITNFEEFQQVSKQFLNRKEVVAHYLTLLITRFDKKKEAIQFCKMYLKSNKSFKVQKILFDFDQVVVNDSVKFHLECIDEIKQFPAGDSLEAIYCLSCVNSKEGVNLFEFYMNRSSTWENQCLRLLHLRWIHLHQIEMSKSKIQQNLVDFLKIFPSNPVVISIYLNDYYQIDQATPFSTSSVFWVFKIMSQLKISAGTSFLFESALQDHPQSVMLWRMYLRCHKDIGLFYRAIAKIPYNKSIWMDSWKLFVMALDQAKEVIDLMNEKEICILTNVDQFL